MKKLFATILVNFLFVPMAWAGTISLHTISADATASGFNNNFTLIANAINGQIQGSATTGSTTNVLADSLGELDMGDEINPRIRTAEVTGIGTDSTTTQTAFVYTGLTPATDSDLTSDVSAGTAYINGYRVVKTATAHTYTASKDTYVDLSQTGAYTFSEVALGASAPAVAANSARLAKVVTDATTIASVTDLANRRIPGLLIPANFRTGMVVSRDVSDTSTLTVSPGTVEINNAMVTTSSVTTLEAATAGNWHSGTEDVATSGYVYVYVDADGNVKLDNTAPTHSNYAVSSTAGRFRYATVTGSTVARILGWGYRDGSGNFNTYEYGNFKEGDAPNNCYRTNQTSDTVDDTSYASDITGTDINFYQSGNPILITGTFSLDSADASLEATISVGGVAITEAARICFASGGAVNESITVQTVVPGGQSTKAIKLVAKVPSSNDVVNGKNISIVEL